MELTVLWILGGLQLKHFFADYMLQWPAMIRDKCHLDRPGGYIHAGIHVAGTLVVLVALGIAWSVIWKLLVAEFVIHLLTDYFKAKYSSTRKHSVSSGAYWTAHGFDQLIHHLTYVALTAAIVLGIVA